MRKSFKRISVLLVIALLVPLILPCVPTMKGLTGTEVYAASKNASINIKKATVGVNSSPQYLYIRNAKTGAKYTMTSKNKKIATVKKDGYDAVINGISKGKTTITVTEKYKGKTKNVGNVAVTVVGAKFENKELTLGVGNEKGIIDYYNPKAKYTFKYSDSSIVKIDKKGAAVGLKLGTTTVSVTESYKGKTTDLGSMKITVAPASIDQNTKYSIYLNSYASTYDLLEYANIINFNDDAIYTAISADPTIVEVANLTSTDGQKYEVLNGLKTGSTTITINEEYDGVKNVLGTVAITIIENPVESFKLFDEEDATQEYYLDDEYSGSRDLSELFDVVPYETTTPITYVSSNNNIVKVDNKGNVTPVSVGTAKITVSCGSFTQDINVIVGKSE